MKQIMQLWKALRKRQGLILVALLIFGVLFSLTSRFLGNKPGGQTSIILSASPSSTNSSGSLHTPVLAAAPSPSPASNIEMISENHMQFSEYDANEKTVYFFDFNTNQLKSLNIQTNQEQILGELNAYVQDLRWAPNHKSILVSLENTQGNAVPNPLYQESIEPDAMVVGRYDIGQRQFTLLNSGIAAFDFLTNDKIIYNYSAGNSKNISISSPDGSSWKELTSFTDKATILRSGSTALVSTESGKVTRYDATGKKIESFDLPAGSTLMGATFYGDGRNGIIATSNKETKALIVTRLKPGAVEELARLPLPEGDFQILWDNKTNTVYLADYNGLAKIATSHP